MKTINSFLGAKRCLFSLILLTFSICVFSQSSIAAWDFANWNPTKAVKTNAPVTTKNLNLTVSDMTLGSGMNTSPNYFSNNVFGAMGSYTAATTLAEAIAKNEYHEFTLTPTGGKYLTVSSINICAATQGVARTFSLFSSKNGFAAANVISEITNLAGVEAGIVPQVLTVTGHADLNTAVTFRIYSYGTGSVGDKPVAIGLRAAPAVADLQVNGAVAVPDVTPPTTPGSLSATSVGATSFRLNWTASTDDNAVMGYDIYNGTTLIGSTTTALFFTVYGLTASTAYTFKVIAKDLSGKQSTPGTLSMTTAATGAGDVPKLPIGMNIPGGSYYSTCLNFTDAMKFSGDMFSTSSGGSWDSGLINEIPRDANGWPTVLPYTTSDGKSSYVRFMINNYYNGRYVMTFDGAGAIEIAGDVTPTKLSNNKYYIDFKGNGQNAWINITQSTSGNYIKNMKILPLIYENATSYPTFNAKFLDGLRPFQAFRFMDWISTNHSNQKLWSDRVTKTYYTQAGSKGASYEYAIELCNELDADAWVTVPHAADDNYITQAARLWRDGLRTNRKVYCEYSNEIWNWMFTQAGYIVDNAPDHPNAYVSTALAAIQAGGGDFPEKDAYMIARSNALWKAEFTGANAARLVRTAPVQHGYVDNTRRVLNYLFDVNGTGCDVVAPGGYFNYQQKDHDKWITRCAAVTPTEVIDSVFSDYDANEGSWTDATAVYANQRGIGYAVYEGGQHIQPWNQGEWCYNQAVYDAQIHPKMYQLYMKNFQKMVDPNVNCTLFMAFAFMGGRESKYGSWGHLENLGQVGSVSNYMTIAPKYQALLDANTPKSSGITTAVTHNKITDNIMVVFPNPVLDELNLKFGIKMDNVEVKILDLQGRNLMTKSFFNSTSEKLVVSNLNNGVYFVKVTANGIVMNSKFIKK